MRDVNTQQHQDAALRKLSDYDKAIIKAAKLSEIATYALIERCRTHNIPVSDALYADGHTDRTTLFRIYAEQENVRFVDLRKRPCDTITARKQHLHAVLKARCIGWMTNSLGQVVYATPNLTQAREVLVAEALIVIVEDQTFEEEVQRIFQDALLADTTACTPVHLSARYEKRNRFLRPMVYSISTALIAYFCIWHPVATLGTIAIILTLFVAVMSSFRALLLFGAATVDRDQTADTTDNVVVLKNPCVSLLIPIYREEHGVAAIIKALEKLDYPPELLDVLLVTEATDDLTRQAISRITLPSWVREISVPYSLPQTKPKAMNYAMHFTRGSIVGIYDAEDAPHPQQLRKVVETFHRSPPNVVCVQARLGYYNAQESWLTRCFAIEYAIWFDVLMKGVRALDLPIPLGGTSVFFRKNVLEELGKWDASNVTEDADLGMRLYRKGYRTELVDCLTLEEATCKVSHWITQRSRWLKGFLQSWMTCLRQSRACINELGIRGFIGMNLLLLGAVLSFLAQPFFWGTALIWAFTDVVWWSGTLGATLEWSVIIILSCGQLVTLISAWQALKRRRTRWLFPWALTLPLYWPLGGIAAYKAIYCFLKNPSFWAKTPHGISKLQHKRDSQTG